MSNSSRPGVLDGPPTGRATTPSSLPASRPAGWRPGSRPRAGRTSPSSSRRRVRPPRPPSSPRTRSRPRPSACRGPTSRPRPATRAAGSAGPRRSSRRAAAPTPRPGRPATPTSSRSRRCSPRRPVAEPERTLHLSTGIIGTRLPLETRPDAASTALIPTLAATDDGLLRRGGGAAHDRFADQGRDDDRRAARCRRPAGDASRVSGIAKGVGMIHPQMATMLSVVLTDAAVAPEVLWSLLRPAAARTWDQLSVDGDTSTNDTVFLLASGASGAAPVEAGSAAAAPSAPPSRRSRATSRASRRPTARAPARSSRPRSRGAGTTPRPGRSRAPSISSSLVKAAAHGRDPNWGRIAGRPGTPGWPIAAVLEAAGLSGRRGGGPCRFPGRARSRDSSGSRSPAISSSTDRGAARSTSIARRRGTRWTRTEVVFALDLGLGTGTWRGASAATSPRRT